MPINVNIPLSREFLLERGHCCNSGCTNCPYQLYIDTPLNKLYNSWKFTTEQINDIKQKMIEYANLALTNSNVQLEVKSKSNSSQI